MTPEEAARLIVEKGPLTRSELRKLSHDKAYEYFQVMNHFLKELGPDAFLARREELREASLRKIVGRESEGG